jgi:hypothetical protein
MLRNRVVSEGVRSVCPAATSGMYEPGEVQDMTLVREETVISPVKNALGDWSEQHPEEMEILRELAADLVQMVETDGNAFGAHTHLTDQNLEQEQKLALWSILAPNSKTRSALKKQEIHAAVWDCIHEIGDNLP